ncbi:MAG: TA system VapC family ribonuclease toxin [Candidatus Dormibacteria bacterium]
MTDLLDVNVLVGLAWPTHVHHTAASTWFRRRGHRSWATTPFTEAGFVRVSSNVSAIPEAVTPVEALDLLRRMREVPGHLFIPDDVPLLVGDHLDGARIATHRQVTDAHLLALARRHGGRLVTLDRALAALSRGEDVVLVPFA